MQVISRKNGILCCVTAEESKCEYMSSYFQMAYIYVLLPLAWTWICPAFWQQDQKMLWTTKIYRLHVIDTVKYFTQELLCSFIFCYGILPPRTCPGCSVPEPYRSHDWALVPAKPGLQGWILMIEWTAVLCFTVSRSKCVMLQTRERNWSSSMQKHWASYGTNRASCNGWWNTAQAPVLKKRAKTMKQLKHCRYVSFNISFLEQLNRTWFPSCYNSLYILCHRTSSKFFLLSIQWIKWACGRGCICLYRQIWSVKFELWYLGHKLKFASEFKFPLS